MTHEADAALPWNNARLELSAKAALGNVSPDLAWLQVGSMVYHAAVQYHPEAQAVADELNLEMDIASLHEVLTEMNPVCGINELHRANPCLNLQNLTKQPALTVLESVIQMLLHSGHYQASADIDTSSRPNSTDSALDTLTNPLSRQSRADQVAWLDRQAATMMDRVTDNSRSGMDQPTEEESGFTNALSIEPAPNSTDSSLRGNSTIPGAPQSREAAWETTEKIMRDSTLKVLAEKNSNSDQAPPTSDAFGQTPSLTVSSLRGNWTPVGTAQSRAERADRFEELMKRSTLKVLAEKEILGSSLDQKTLEENSATELPSIER